MTNGPHPAFWPLADILVFRRHLALALRIGICADDS
jgi:hypothetical protein